MNTFSTLLDALIAAPVERQPALHQLIRDTFQRRKAVLALDMSGFTLTVRRDGILSYLCQIRRMQKLTLPIVVAHKGDLVKYDADNLLAVFDDARHAVDAALAMIAAAAAQPEGNAPPIAFSIGIDYGELLLLERVDCFGDPVNLAYKLGEDIARPSEILITQKVRDQLGDHSRFRLKEMPVSVSGVEVMAYGVTHASA
jgi:adenylate cyclase